MILRNVFITIVLTLLYAILRYNVFGEIPVTDIPTLIVNKAVAFTMIIILILAFIKRINRKSEAYNNYLSIFKIFVLIHILISISLLSQNYYPKLFTNEKLSFFGNISILTGILAFTYLINTKYKIRSLLFFLLLAAHLFFIGVKGWFNIENWNGMMPPITFICFLIIIVLTALSGFNKKCLNSE